MTIINKILPYRNRIFLSAAGTADYENVFATGIFRLFGRLFTVRHPVCARGLKYRVYVQLYVVGGSQ